VAPAIKNTLGARPIVSLAMMAAISKAQVIISSRAKVPNMDLGVPFIPQAYCGNLAILGTSRYRSLSGLVTLFGTLVTGFTRVIESFWIRGIR
jgi:hypothetical protein